MNLGFLFSNVIFFNKLKQQFVLVIVFGGMTSFASVSKTNRSDSFTIVVDFLMWNGSFQRAYVIPSRNFSAVALLKIV